MIVISNGHYIGGTRAPNLDIYLMPSPGVKIKLNNLINGGVNPFPANTANIDITNINNNNDMLGILTTVFMTDHGPSYDQFNFMLKRI